MILENTSGSELSLIIEWSIGQQLELNRENINHWATQPVVDALESGDLTMFCGLNELNFQTARAYLKQSMNSSLAVDKNNIDQSISGTDWITIEAERDIWDIGSDFDMDSNDFIVPYDGIYFHDGQMKIINMSGVESVELPIFKRGDPDDYWFMFDKKIVQTGSTECQLCAATLFDFYYGDRLTLKIKLLGESPSATISGDDDFTAWGYTFEKMIYVDCN